MKTILCLLLSLVVLLSGYEWRTGPSYMSSKIIPVSINDKGEILCKTSFYQNASGAHRFMTATYGACVIANGKLIEHKGRILDPDVVGVESEAYELMNHYDSIFEMKTTPEQLIQLTKLIDKQYKFTTCNAELFKINRAEISIRGFEKKEGVVLSENPQKALRGKKSIAYHSNRKVKELYNFGSIIFLENLQGDGEMMGAEFDYYSYEWEADGAGPAGHYGYDLYEVIGVLIKE